MFNKRLTSYLLISSFLITSSFFVGSYVGRNSGSDSYQEQIKRAISLTEEKNVEKTYLPLDFRYPYVYDPTEPSFTIERDSFLIDSPIEKLSIDSFLYIDSVNKEIKHRKISFNNFCRKIRYSRHFRNSYNSNF